jgi:hypothetical protein
MLPAANKQRRPARLILAAAILGSLLHSGCGYMVGGNFPPEIRTVYVPVFKNTTNRRGLEYQLTEAVQREIQKQTPFRLAKGPAADTKLVGTISLAQKSNVGETANDDPRVLMNNFTVTVSWVDTNTDRIFTEHAVQIPAEVVALAARSVSAPEVGQSRLTAYQDAIDQLARDIVSRMEAPW